MTDYEPDAWRRLARLLRSRRAHLDPRFSKRNVFCESTGLNYKLVQDIEGAPTTRTSFSDEAFALFESAYRWAPGSIAQVLSGGEPTEVAAVTATAAATVVPTHRGPSQDGGNEATLHATLPALTGSMTGHVGQSQGVDLVALRERAEAEGKTVGQVMVEEGLAHPDELKVPDALPVDPIIAEIEASNLSDETKAQAIRWHRNNRAQTFERERLRREAETQTDR